MLIRKTQVLIKAESPNGTWNAPGVGDGLLAYNVVATPEFAMFKRDPHFRDLSRYESLSGMQSATISFSVEVRGDGVAAIPPTNIATAMAACNFQISGLDALIPKSTDVTTISIQIEEDGEHKRFKGCAGNVTIGGNVGEPMFLNFTFRGTIHDIQAGTLSTLTGLPTVAPPVLLSAAFSTNVGGAENHLISAIEFDMQNEITLSPDVSAATGIRAARIVGRNPIGSMDPEYNTTYDWLADIITNAQGTLSLVLGSVSNNTITITAPQIRFLAMDPLDRDGIRALTVPFELNRSAGDDEIKLEWS